MVVIFLPAFVMLSFHLTALGGRLGDRFSKPGIFVIFQLVSAGLGLALFG
jgi:hypothetical protein